MIPPPHLETIQIGHTQGHHRILNEVLPVDLVLCTLTRKMKTTDLGLEIHEVRLMSAHLSVHPGDTSINGTTMTMKDAHVTPRLTPIHPETPPVHLVYTLVTNTPPLLVVSG